MGRTNRVVRCGPVLLHNTTLQLTTAKQWHPSLMVVVVLEVAAFLRDHAHSQCRMFQTISLLGIRIVFLASDGIWNFVWWNNMVIGEGEVYSM